MNLKFLKNVPRQIRVEHREDYDNFKKACDGNDAVARLLINSISQKGFMVAWRMIGNSALAQDIVQDALLKLFEKRSYRGESSLSTYFHVMISRMCLDYLGSSKRVMYEGNEDDLSNLIGNEVSVLEKINELETHTIIQKAILSLNPRQRVALVAWAYQDASINEIASMLEINSNAATQLLHRAKFNLEISLREMGYEK